MTELEPAEHHRLRAMQMLKRAETAPTEVLKSAYRLMAADWAELAQASAGLTKLTNSTPMPSTK